MKPTVARSNIVDDGSLMTFGPCVPDEIDLVSSFHVDVGLTSQSTFVAVDIRRSKSTRRYESNILVQSIPARRYRARLSILDIIPPYRIRTLCSDTVITNTGNKT